MKVVHLSSEKSWRGGEQQIAYLIEELSNHHYAECHVICRKGSPFEAYCKNNNIPYLATNFSNSFNLVTAYQIAHYCKKHDINIMHMHSSKSHSLGILSLLMSNPAHLVLSRRVEFPIKKSFFTQWKYNHKRIKRIICVSNRIKEVVESDTKTKGKCVTVYSGIDLKKFDNDADSSFFRKQYNIPEENKIIANTSALTSEKDYYTFIDAAEILIKQDIKASFLIIGDGPLRQELETYIQNKSLSQKIIFTGFIENLKSVIKGINIFLITSTTEGLGTSVLDAFACKIPVVATAAGGIPEMVKHNETGLLAPVKDAKQISVYLKQLLEDEVLSNKLTQGASQLLQQFTKEVTARKTFEIYKKIMKL